MAISDYVDLNLAIYDKRNGAALNPITIVKVVESSIYKLIVGFEEPSFNSVPLNVLWICSNPAKAALYRKVWRRTSKAADSVKGTRNTWEEITDVANLYTQAQTYDLDGSFLLGELSIGQSLPSASDSVKGITKLSVPPTGEPTAISTNDPRMSDARTPVTHTHPLEPSEQFIAAGGATNVNTGPAPVAGNAFVINSQGEAIWRNLTSADVYIPPTLLTNITITGPSTAFETDTNIAYSCTAYFDNNTNQHVTPAWSSSDNTIASISNTGLVTINSITANQVVTFTAAYTFAGVTKTDTHTLTISNVNLLTGLAITGVNTVLEGSTADYMATATFDNGSQSVVTPTWTITGVPSGSTVTVNANGTVSATNVLASFTATLQASYTLGGITKTATKSLSIVDAPVTLDHITVTTSGLPELYEGGTKAFVCTAYYSNGTNAVKSTGVTWSMTVGTYATIASSGIVTGLTVNADQTDQVNASYTENGITKTASLNVTIKDNVPTGLTIAGSATVNEGTTSSYTATLAFANGSTQNVTPSSTFTSTDGSFAAAVYTAPTVTADTTVTLNASYVYNGTTINATPKTITVINVAAVAHIMYGLGVYGINTEAGILALSSQLPTNTSGQNITLNMTGQNFGYFAVPSTVTGAANAVFRNVADNSLGGWDGASWPQNDIGTTNGPITVPGTLDGAPITWYLYRTDFAGVGNQTFNVTWA